MSDREQPVLRVLTFENLPDPEPPEPCEGGYTCSCDQCARQRAERVARGRRPRRHDQPWAA